MPVYEPLLRGENVLWIEDNAIKRIAFYTTRWVDASDETEAGTLVIDTLRQAPELQKPDWHHDSGPDAKVYVKEEQEIISGWNGRAGGAFILFEDGS